VDCPSEDDASWRDVPHPKKLIHRIAEKKRSRKLIGYSGTGEGQGINLGPLLVLLDPRRPATGHPTSSCPTGGPSASVCLPLRRG
jgi:hypothetical protein